MRYDFNFYQHFVPDGTAGRGVIYFYQHFVPNGTALWRNECVVLAGHFSVDMTLHCFHNFIYLFILIVGIYVVSEKPYFHLIFFNKTPLVALIYN